MARARKPVKAPRPRRQPIKTEFVIMGIIALGVAYLAWAALTKTHDPKHPDAPAAAAVPAGPEVTSEVTLNQGDYPLSTPYEGSEKAAVVLTKYTDYQ